jgi:hypothetical protein
MIAILKQEIIFEFGRIAEKPSFHQFHYDFRNECFRYAEQLINDWQNVSFRFNLEGVEDIDLWVMFFCNKHKIPMKKEFQEEWEERKNEIDFNNV